VTHDPTRQATALAQVQTPAGGSHGEPDRRREEVPAEPAEGAAKATLSPEKLAEMCGRCKGRCCEYYTVYLDEPEDAEDFDELRWFLAHEGCHVYIDEGQWHLNVATRCRFLGADGRCSIYEHRPTVCRDFGREEECEFTCEFDFERTFRTLKDIEDYAREKLPPEEFARLPVFPEGYDGPR